MQVGFQAEAKAMGCWPGVYAGVGACDDRLHFENMPHKLDTEWFRREALQWEWGGLAVYVSGLERPRSKSHT